MSIRQLCCLPVLLLVAGLLHGQAGPAQDLLVSSRFNDRILRYDGTTGEFRSVFAVGGLLDNPNGIAYGPDGHLYAGLGDSGRVLRYDGQTGAFLNVFVGNDPSTTVDETGGLSACRAIAFGPDGDLYVDDGPNDRVLRYDGSSGRFVGVATSGNDLSGPVGLTFAADGTMYVGGALSNGAYAFRDGTLVRRFFCDGQLGMTGVLVGADRHLYAGDPIRNMIYRFDTDTGQCSIFASGGGLNVPIGLTWAEDGNLLVGSFNTNSVIKYDRASGALMGTFIVSGAGGLLGTHNFAFVPPPGPMPSLSIISPANGAAIPSGAALIVRSDQFTIACSADGARNSPDHGILRVEVDGNLDQIICVPIFTLNGTYAPGPHQFRLSLVNYDGTPLSPPVTRVGNFSIDDTPPPTGPRRRSARH